MGDGQTLLERCLLLPSDDTARKVFADWLQEHGDEELAGHIRGERGAEYLCVTRNLANLHARFPCLKFLWGVVLIHMAEQDRRTAALETTLATTQWPPGQLLTMPPGFEVVERPRTGLFRRLFGG